LALFSSYNFSLIYLKLVVLCSCVKNTVDGLLLIFAPAPTIILLRLYTIDQMGQRLSLTTINTYYNLKGGIHYEKSRGVWS
jgi:hypothetical protein